MYYETFKETILQRLSEDIPDPKRITIRKVYRNNGTSLDGLVILENGVNIGPALYLNHYYGLLRNGESLASVYRRIMGVYQRNKAGQSVDAGFFQDFDRVRGRIVPKLVHREKNRDLLETEVPHIPFLDLAIVFCCAYPVDPELGSATILIEQAHCRLWDMDAETLYAVAMENAGRNLAPQLTAIDQVLSGLLGTEEQPAVSVPADSRFPLYVLTNEQNLFGASCMVYDGLLRSYADQFDSDLFILPSSIHEILLVPTDGREQLEEFSRMVREVNATQVAPEDILSDHAYFYSRAQDAILY